MKTNPTAKTTADFAAKERKERKERKSSKLPLLLGRGEGRGEESPASASRRSGVSGERRTLRFQGMAALARAAATPAPTPRLRQSAVHLPSSILHPLRLRLSLSASVGERAGVRCRRPSLAILFACFAYFAVSLTAPAQVWLTNSLTLSETNPTYDGADLVISGAGVAAARPPSTPCSSLTAPCPLTPPASAAHVRS